MTRMLNSRQHNTTFTHQSEERMKEKSKAAARARREKENAEYAELAKLLPLQAAIANQLDKASVIRLCVCYLKMRHVVPEMRSFHPNYGWPGYSYHYAPSRARHMLLEGGMFGTSLVDSLEGFLFVLAADGKIIYVSESVSKFLGSSQVDLTGNSIYEYINTSDQNEIKQALTPPPPPKQQEYPHIPPEYEAARNFQIRMKCTLPKRDAGITNAGYKVIHCTGYIKVRYLTYEQADGSTGGCYHNIGLLAIGQSFPTTPNTDVRLYPNMFMFRASLDLKLIFVDQLVTQLLGYEPQELIEKTLYQHVHAADIMHLKDAHSKLLNKGQVKTKCYRFLTKHSGWVWIQSDVTIVHNTRSSRPHCIVSVNTVISKVEKSECVLSSVQIESSSKLSAGCETQNASTSGGAVPSSSSTARINRKRKLARARTTSSGGHDSLRGNSRLCETSTVADATKDSSSTSRLGEKKARYSSATAAGEEKDAGVKFYDLSQHHSNYHRAAELGSELTKTSHDEQLSNGRNNFGYPASASGMNGEHHRYHHHHHHMLDPFSSYHGFMGARSHHGERCGDSTGRSLRDGGAPFPSHHAAVAAAINPSQYYLSMHNQHSLGTWNHRVPPYSYPGNLQQQLYPYDVPAAAAVVAAAAKQSYARDHPHHHTQHHSANNHHHQQQSPSQQYSPHPTSADHTATAASYGCHRYSDGMNTYGQAHYSGGIGDPTTGKLYSGSMTVRCLPNDHSTAAAASTFNRYPPGYPGYMPSAPPYLPKV